MSWTRTYYELFEIERQEGDEPPVYRLLSDHDNEADAIHAAMLTPLGTDWEVCKVVRTCIAPIRVAAKGG